MQPIIHTHVDLMNAIRLSYSKRYMKKKKWLLFSLEILFISIAIALYLLSCSDYDSLLMLSIFGSIILPMAFLIVWYVQIPIIAKKDFQKSKLFSQPQTTHWDDQYIYSNMQDIQSKFTWAIYIDLQEDPDLLLLYTGNRTFNIFPKRFFDSPEELNQFRNYAQQGIHTNTK